MLAHLILSAVLVGGTVTEGPKRVYVVSWADGAQAPLAQQVDRQLRDELSRRGATVVEQCTATRAIVLKPSLEVTAKGMKLSVVGVRQQDRAVLGTVSTKVAGSSRAAQLKALVSRTCDEADLF